MNQSKFDEFFSTWHEEFITIAKKKNRYQSQAWRGEKLSQHFRSTEKPNGKITIVKKLQASFFWLIKFHHYCSFYSSINIKYSL